MKSKNIKTCHPIRIKVAFLSLAITALGFSSQSANAAVITSTLYRVGVDNFGDEIYDHSTIDFWNFTQNSLGTTTFDILSWGAFDSDRYDNLQILLYGGSQTIGSMEFIAQSFDDNGLLYSAVGGTPPLFGGDDGSTDAYDPFLNIELAAGDYTLVVTRSYVNESAFTNNPAQFEDPLLTQQGLFGLHFEFGYWSVNIQSSEAQYQLTVNGDVTGFGVVPEPSSMLLVGLGLATTLSLRRR
jgi:PEP-CTERM motif